MVGRSRTKSISGIKAKDKIIIKRKTQIILALFATSVFLFEGCATLSRGTPEGRFPERKHGAKLIITKKDRLQTAGELITVKEKSLLLLNTEGWDVSVRITDIRDIRILRRAKAGTGAAIGAGISFVFGAAYVTLFNLTVEHYDRSSWWWVPLFGAVCSLPGLLIGGAIGAVLGLDKTIQIEGMSESEIEETLEYLRKKARIRDYK